MTTVEELHHMVAAVQGQRNPKATDRKPNPFKKFIFRGCWECREAHSRHECPKWKALLAANNGVPPTGHKGAKDKAWAKWKADKQAHQASKKKTASTINALSDGKTLRTMTTTSPTLMSTLGFPRLWPP